MGIVLDCRRLKHNRGFELVRGSREKDTEQRRPKREGVRGK